MIYFQSGSESADLSSSDLREGLHQALRALGARKKVLAVPPDYTRFHSRAGELTAFAGEYFGEALVDVLPALGTHAPMSSDALAAMFPGVSPGLFRVHDWRADAITVGTVPADYVSKVTGGAADFEWPAQLNRLLARGGHDLILSIGQVVPHEVMGMANYNKNLFVGTGGCEGINKSHYMSAVYGMERLMGRADNPLRSLLDYASERFIPDLPVVYVQTVIGRREDGRLATRGLFIGDGREAFELAAELSVKVNVEIVAEPIRKAVVYLDPGEYASTWLGNKSIYRTRLAMADGGELVVLAPGVAEFGEDGQIDALIRKYGYRGRDATLAAVAENADLRLNLSAAAHLIHGSAEGRFRVTYCPGKLTRGEVESVGYGYAPLGEALRAWDPEGRRAGWNTSQSGESFYFIPNPGIGLWASAGRLTGR
jgi:nickel-dependent lactate racemase